MSVQDVCDLGSLLHNKDNDTQLLQKKLVGQKAEIITQEGRLQHEIDETEKELQSVPDIEIKSKKLEHDMDIITLKFSHLTNDTKVTDRYECDKQKVEMCVQLHSELVSEVDASLAELNEAKIEMEKARLCILSDLRKDLRTEDQNQALQEQSLDNIRTSLHQMQTSLEKLALQHFSLTTERTVIKEDGLRKDCHLIELHGICNSLNSQVQNSASRLSETMSTYHDKLLSLQDGIIALSIEIDNCNSSICNFDEQIEDTSNKYQDALRLADDENNKLALKILAMEKIKNENIEATKQLLEKEKNFRFLKGEYAAILQGIENEGIRMKHFEDSSIVVRSFDEIQEEVKGLKENIAYIKDKITLINNEISGDISSTDIEAAISILKSSVAEEHSIQQKLIELGDGVSAADGSSIIDSLNGKAQFLIEQIFLTKADVSKEINMCNTLETSNSICIPSKIPHEKINLADVKSRNEASLVTEMKLEEEAKVLSDQRKELNLKLLEIDQAIKISYDNEEKAHIKACKEAAINSRRLTVISRHETAMLELRKEMTTEDERFQRACKPTAELCDSLRTQLARLKQEIASSMSDENTHEDADGRGVDSHVSNQIKTTRLDPTANVDNENALPNTFRVSSPSHVFRSIPSPTGQKRVPAASLPKGLSQSSQSSAYYNDDWDDDDAFTFNAGDQKRRK